MNSKQLNYILGAIVVIALAAVAYMAWGNQNQQQQAINTNANVVENTNSANANTNTNTETPTPDPEQTANWKTYSNTKFGFRFKYPEGYDYKIGESCNKAEGKDYCLITLENGYSKFIVAVNNPGTGWFSVLNPAETGKINIGGITTDYKYGRAANEGGNEEGTSVFLASFVDSGNNYDLAYTYREAHPGVFFEQIIQPLIATFKFVK